MKKIFVLDTSVLIHDPSSIFKFETGSVVIPLAVLIELDNLKTQEGIVGYNARKIINLLDKLTSKSNTIQIIGHSNLDYPTMDLAIIHTCLDLRQKNEHKVVLVSKDANMRVMARYYNLVTEDYNNGFHNDLSEQLFEINVDKTLIDNLYSNTSVDFSGEKGCYILKNGSSSALAYNIGTKLLLVKNEVELFTPEDSKQMFLTFFLTNNLFDVVAVIGNAGTGKTYVTLGVGLEQLMKKKYKKLLLLKPTVPIGKDLGFLPGEKEDKLAPWLQSYMDNLEQFSSWEYLRDSIEIEAITYLRGRNLVNKFVIVDEVSNITPHQVKTILSRIGKGSKVVFLGDINQIDNPYLNKTSNGLVYLINRLKHEQRFAWIELTNTYRSKIAKMAELL